MMKIRIFDDESWYKMTHHMPHVAAYNISDGHTNV